MNEIRIVRDGKAVDRGQVGEVWLWVSSSAFRGAFWGLLSARRGPNVMKEYWRDPG